MFWRNYFHNLMVKLSHVKKHLPKDLRTILSFTHFFQQAPGKILNIIVQNKRRGEFAQLKYCLDFLSLLLIVCKRWTLWNLIAAAKLFLRSAQKLFSASSYLLKLLLLFALYKILSKKVSYLLAASYFFFIF